MTSREHYKHQYEKSLREIDHLNRRISSLKGVITHLKNRLNCWYVSKYDR